MSEKKVVSRSVAVGLGLVCVVVVAGLVGVLMYYTLAIDDRNITITGKNNQIASLNTQISDQNSTISSLNLSITNLQSQVNNLTDILNLGKSTTLYNGTITIVASLELTKLEFNIPYAGYVSVKVSSSQSNETVSILAAWGWYWGVNYGNNFGLGNNGTAIFPVLPDPYMVVYFADPNLSYPNSETANVTITYYY